MPYLRVKNELPLIPGYAEGAIAYAPDAADAPLNDCICYINPEQSGSGDPSPDNVRPITGHTELNLVQKDGNDTVVHTYTTDLGTTVYGGTLDVVSGVLTTKYAIIDMGSLSYTKHDVAEGTLFRTQIDGAKTTYNVNNLVCSAYHWVLKENRTNGTVSIPDSNGNIDFINDSYSDATVFKTAMTGQTVCYELATPTTTQLTPQEVKSLLGSNNFYHDCNGDTKITYIRRLDS